MCAASTASSMNIRTKSSSSPNCGKIRFTTSSFENRPRRADEQEDLGHSTKCEPANELIFPKEIVHGTPRTS